MSQNRRNNVLRSKQRRNNVPPNIFRGFELRTRVGLMFRRSNHSMKINWDVFRCYKLTSKVFFVYLECKLQQDRYVWCIYKSRCHKTVQRRYLATSKEIIRYGWYFYKLNCLRKGNNGSFRHSKQKSKVQSNYLAFKSLKISCKWSQQWSKSQRQSTNDVFGG